MKCMRLAVICALACTAMAGDGKTPWYKERGTPQTLRSAGFAMRAQFPRGWTVVDDTIVPAPALGPGCNVEVQFYRDKKWDDFLVSVLDLAETQTVKRREALRIDGRGAVSDEYVSGGEKVFAFYVNLTDVEPDSGAVLTLRERLSLAEGDCALQFLALVQTSSFARDDPR